MQNADVFPIENGDVPVSHVSLQGCVTLFEYTYTNGDDDLMMSSLNYCKSQKRWIGQSKISLIAVLVSPNLTASLPPKNGAW